MQDLRDLLQSIKSGIRSFAPSSATASDISIFQETAKALVYANEQGYLDGFVCKKESTTGNRWYIHALVLNGLTYEGEAYLKELSSRVEPVASTPPFGFAAESITDILQLLELAARDALPFSISRSTAVSLQAARELLDAGHLSGQLGQSPDGLCVVGPAITLSGRLFLDDQKKRRAEPNQRGNPLSITLDTNCIINLFDRQSASATSVPELNALIRHSFSGRLKIAITTRVEADMLRDSDAGRRDEMLRTLEAFPVVGTIARFDTSQWDKGDVFTSERLDQLGSEIKAIVFPGLQPTDNRYSNKVNDIDHLIGHLINRHDIFVTDDRDILNRSEQLRTSPGIVVMSPAQCVKYVDGIAARSTPRTLSAGTQNPAYHSPALKGAVTFDYSNNDHRYTIGIGHFLFETCWSKASKTSIYAYSDADSIRCLAIARGASAIAQVTDAHGYDYSSRTRMPKLGEIVIWNNVNGIFAATKILSIKDDSRGDDHDELKFEYVILAQGGADFSSS